MKLFLESGWLSGVGGFDCFLAAKAVGDTGHVIGVDMTPEMITKDREGLSCLRRLRRTAGLEADCRDEL